MVDYFALFLPHLLLALATLRLLYRGDLDADPARTDSADEGETKPVRNARR